jgi:hypothetical protein
MTFPQKPTVRDLSDLKELKSFPSFSSSMAGGNMVTQKSEDFAGQGSDSEASHDVVAREMTDFGNAQKTPDLPGPETPASELGTAEKGTGWTPAPPAWKELT